MDPCVVVANSCAAIPPDTIIKELLETEELLEPLIILPEVRGYEWHIDTKYYEADVRICALDQKSIGTQDFADSVNAVILPFDSFSEDGLTLAEQWLSFMNAWDAEIKILICDKCAPEDFPVESTVQKPCISKYDAQSWCVQNGFELVELDPILHPEDSDVEDDFPESTGMKRVVQALYAHVWPNLIMKENGTRPPPMIGLQSALNGLGRNLASDSNGENAVPVPENKVNGDSLHPVETDACRKKLVAEVKPTPKEAVFKPSNVAVVSPTVVSAAPSDPSGASASNFTDSATATSSESPLAAGDPSPTRDERLDAMLQAVDTMPADTFEELFQNLSAMKNKAESLSPNQRKVYAEKMAVAFWKSIGGNDSEVEGLSSDDD